MHQCPVCRKPFPSPSKLQRHYVIHTGQKPFTCIICRKAFTQSDHLKSHMQKFHHSRLPTDHLPDSILSHILQPNCDKPTVEIKTRGNSNSTVLPWTVSSSAASQPEWKMDIVTHKICLPSTETGNPSENMPHVNYGSETKNSISDVKDPVPQEQVDSANVNTSLCSSHNGYTCNVCLKPFTSSLQLWIHSSSHKKPKLFEKEKESGLTSSKKANLNGHVQTAQDLSSNRNNMTLKHQCPKCLKTFCSPSKLQRHLLIHMGQKPYSCKIGRKAFRQKVHLKSHLYTANTCSLSAGTERKKQRFCNSRQTSDLQPQSSLEQRCTSRPTPVNSSVELELQCKISVNAAQDLNKTEIKSDAVIKPQQPSNTSSQCQNICPNSDKEEQQCLRPFQCMICNRSFRLEINLIRHCKVHRTQKELESATTEQNSDHVKTSDSESVRHLPEPSHLDPTDLNIIVKPETWSVNCSDPNDSLPQYSEFITSAEKWRETHHASDKWQRTNTLHQCQTCLKCFPSSSKLQRHTMTHTGQRPFVCETCGKRFRQKTHLRVHCHSHLRSRYHKQRSLHIKSFCIGGFNTRTAADIPVQNYFLQKNDFQKHTGGDVGPVKHLDRTPSMVIIKNEDRKSDNKLLLQTSRKCEIVPLRNLSKVTVKRTQTAESRKNPGNVQHKCFRCLKCFPSASKLQRHEMVHTGLKPFQCLVCGKAFRQAPHLKTHERTRCGGKPSKPVNQQGDVTKLKADSQKQLYPGVSVHIPPQKDCVNTDTTLSKVDGAFSNGVSELLCISHEISTTKVNLLFKTNSKSNITCKKRKLHMCPICFKNFDFPYKLSRHLVIHSGIRPYKCTLCSKTFTQRGHLKIHEHGCRQMYRYADTVEIPGQSKGVANSESNTLLSDELMSSLVENEKQPEDYWCEPLTVFECDKCTESFNSENSLKQHICSSLFPAKMTYVQRHRCDICSKHFVSPSKLNRHYLIHTGQRPFSCDICGKTFTQSAHARKHRLTH